MEEYITLKSRCTAEICEKRSRFIGAAAPVSTAAEAAAFINEIKSQNRDARHNVYAYILKNGDRKFSDDGEPQGTGGIPVLEVIAKSGICDCAVVVTRYFGGILLGAGGLVRAYSAAAALSIKSAEIVRMCETLVCSVECDYNQIGILNALISSYGNIKDSFYTEKVEFRFFLPENMWSVFENQLRETTADSVKAVVLEKIFCEYQK